MAIDRQPITQSDIEEFLRVRSDFGFEMAVLQALRGQAFECEHAATYRDPITQRIRSFDFRARKKFLRWQLRLAVECKNVRPESPVLVHATPREQGEAYYTWIKRHRINGAVFNDPIRTSNDNVYRQFSAVGRQVDQPYRDGKGDFSSSDSGTYDKWLQAVNGTADLLNEVVREPFDSAVAHAVLPVLVVPDGMLWQVDYGTDGRVETPVRSVDATTLIIRHQWSAADMFSTTLDISHLEVVTLTGLKGRLAHLLGRGGLFDGIDRFLDSR